MTPEQLVQAGYRTGVEDALNRLSAALHENGCATGSDLYLAASESIKTLLGEKR